MKFIYNNAQVFERDGVKGWIYSGKEDFERANVVYLDVTGAHGKIKNTKSDKIYYVLSGKGEFITKEEKMQAQRRDVIIVPRGTPYYFRSVGKSIFKILLVSAPSFDRAFEVKLDKLEPSSQALIKLPFRKEETVGWEGWTAWPYGGRDIFERASALYCEVTTRHGKIKTTVSDRVYYVLEGKGEFIINDEVIPVQKSDVIIVTKNTPYDYRAADNSNLKLYMVHIPAFDPQGEVKLENSVSQTANQPEADKSG